jgi:hypothetical protein
MPKEASLSKNPILGINKGEELSFGIRDKRVLITKGRSMTGLLLFLEARP